MNKSKLLSLLLVLMLSFASVSLVSSQKRSGGSSSKGSSSKSTSGAVRVKGYYRKDGTYVQPHYRSAPDGNFGNNWSTKGNVNPFTGKVGTKEYPLGGWLSSDKKTVFNTPFQGVTADFSSRTVRIKTSSVRGLAANSVLTHHRSPRSTTFMPIESWEDTCLRARAGGEKEWWVQGSSPDGKPFTIRLAILGPSSWSGQSTSSNGLSDTSMDENASVSLSPFIGIEADPDLSAVRIGKLTSDTGCEVGWAIEAVRKFGGEDVYPVTSWQQLRTIAQGMNTKRVVILGRTLTGGKFEVIVAMRTR